MKNTSCAALHWPFSLAVYGAPSVASSCLALQDDIGLDVNVLLLSLLASRLQRRPLSRVEIAQVDAQIVAWRQEVVAALRQIRRRLKTGPAPAPNDDTERLRNAVKAAELEAEKLQQGVMAPWFDTLGASFGPVGRAQPPAGGFATVLRTTAQHVVEHYSLAGDAGERRLSDEQRGRYADIVALAANHAPLQPAPGS